MIGELVSEANTLRPPRFRENLFYEVSLGALAKVREEKGGTIENTYPVHMIL